MRVKSMHFGYNTAMVIERDRHDGRVDLRVHQGNQSIFVSSTDAELRSLRDDLTNYLNSKGIG